jgi:hypothetical protein
MLKLGWIMSTRLGHVPIELPSSLLPLLFLLSLHLFSLDQAQLSSTKLGWIKAQPISSFGFAKLAHLIYYS